MPSFFVELGHDAIEFLKRQEFVACSLVIDVNGVQHLQKVIVGRVIA